MRRFFLPLRLLLLIPLPAGSASAAPDDEVFEQRITAGIDLLNRTYWSPTLKIWFSQPGDDLRAYLEGRQNPPWWPSANAVEVLLDFMQATGTSTWQADIEALYDLRKDPQQRAARLAEECKRRKQWSDADERRWQSQRRSAAVNTGYYSDFQNEYLDDSGWWAITWLKMYDRTRGEKYLTTAKTIHAHMAKNWRPDEGGIRWCEDADKQKANAITNNLFIILSARLYLRTHDQTYLAWADKTLDWCHANGLYDGIGVIDGPGHHADYWSYNQGTYLGALAALYEATEREEYLKEAIQVADTVLHRAGFTLPDGVIVEKIGTTGDASLFKGVFVRYLGQLRDLLATRKLSPDTAREIGRCIRASAESLWKNRLGADGALPTEWHDDAKDRTTGFNAQISALAALVAALPRRNP